jgi:hypothetical protein
MRLGFKRNACVKVWKGKKNLTFFAFEKLQLKEIRGEDTFCGTPFRCVRKIAKSDYYLHVHPSVRVEQIGSQWKNFDGILYLGFIRKLVEKVKFH